jgi:phosphatidate cytidylyltransferase
MLRERLRTAGVLVAVFVAIFLLSPAWLLCAIATLVVVLAAWEYYAMTDPRQALGDRILCLALAALFPAAALAGKPDLLIGLLFFSFLLLCFRSLFGTQELRNRFEEIHRRFFGIVWVGFTLSHFLLLTCLDSWRAWVFTILIVIYVGDGAAYFSGTYLGKRKLAPRLSPKKTWEGAAGGLLGSVAAMFLCKVLFFSPLSTAQALWVAVLLAVSGQMGDLVESLVKRCCDVKDSGNILPGHGGILDRIDSVLFAFPTGYYLAAFFQHA